MKKFIIIVLLVVVGLSINAQTNKLAFIHRDGNSLKDSKNNPVKLNGVCLGGWLLWEAWIWGGGLNSESKLAERIETSTSKETFDKFRYSFYRNFITKKDIEKIAKMGFNCIRVPINYKLLTDYSEPNSKSNNKFEILDSLISWCDIYKVYVVLDLHALPGGQNGLFICDPDKVKLWDDEKDKAKSVSVWYEIAKRYSQSKIIAGYDLINEPGASKASDLVNLYQRIIDTIRIVDKNHLLIVEGNSFAHNFDCFTKLLDSNQVFSFHFYPWLKGTNGKLEQLKGYSDFAKKVGAPIWCGEWGEDTPENLEQIKKLLNDNNYDFCGNAFWTWKKVTLTNNFPLNEISVSNDWKKFIKNENISKGKSYDDLLNDFISQIKIENTTVNHKMFLLFTTN